MLKQAPYRRTLRRRSRGRAQRGIALIEAVFGIVILSVITFGIAELGFACKDAAAMYNYARDCARDLAAGRQYSSTVSKVCTAANGTGAFTQTLSSSNFTILYSTDGGKTFTQAVANDGTKGVSNNIPQGDLFRVDLSYSHSRVTDLIGLGSIPMHAYAIMMRQ